MIRFRRRRADHPESGSVIVEAVLVVPALMLLLVVVVEFVLWAHAVQVVQLAASEGDRVARSSVGTAQAGVTQARSVVAADGATISVSTIQVRVLPGDLVSVTVSGRAESLLPGVSLPVTATVVGPMQEFRVSG